MKLNKIYQGDARNLIAMIEPKSIDVIFTDPPYAKQWLNLYQWLADISPIILKPKGFLLTYCGGMWKDDIMAMFRKTMEFFWDIAVIISGDNSVIWAKKVVAGYKSILIYRLKGLGAMPNWNIYGASIGSIKDKRFHGWQQPEQEARYYIESFSSPGELVFDPFVGGGTTQFVCTKIGRNFIGFDNDPQAIKQTNNRLTGIIPESKQSELFSQAPNSQGKRK